MFSPEISGWGHPLGTKGSLTVTVRLHFADYIRRTDVPESEFAFDLHGRQVRDLSIEPRRTTETVARIELVEGSDDTAPVVMAITAEPPTE